LSFFLFTKKINTSTFCKIVCLYAKLSIPLLCYFGFLQLDSPGFNGVHGEFVDNIAELLEFPAVRAAVVDEVKVLMGRPMYDG